MLETCNPYDDRTNATARDWLVKAGATAEKPKTQALTANLLYAYGYMWSGDWSLQSFSDPFVPSCGSRGSAGYNQSIYPRFRHVESVELIAEVKVRFRQTQRLLHRETGFVVC